MRRYSTLVLSSLLLASAAPLSAQQRTAPKLVVEIVVSQMRYEFLDRFEKNFSNEGFRLFAQEGANYTEARYNYMQTGTVAGLATLTTGANPSGHGIIARSWYNFTTGDSVNLIADTPTRGLDCEAGENGYAPVNLTAATLGDRLLQSDTLSKVYAVAWDPYSAVVAGGVSGKAFWFDPTLGKWVTSSYYTARTPEWLTQYNAGRFAAGLIEREWIPELPRKAYVGSDSTILNFDTPSGMRRFFQGIASLFKKREKTPEVASILYMPWGNTLVSDMARSLINHEQLGKDDHTDLLTICYDSPRLMTELFGPSSLEVEDMYYKLDREIGNLVTLIRTVAKPEETLIVITSDHGSSSTYREGTKHTGGEFNADQFKMIMNGFLSAQYEPGEWVLGYVDRQLYLNRALIYKYGFNLNEVQARAASFALQFRGVAGAWSSTGLQGGSFDQGYGAMAQNSFYPRRSGDVLINLMPGWIEQGAKRVAQSGSLYEYDTHVPLMLLGGGIAPMTVDRNVTMTQVAPSMARLMRIPLPDASTSQVLTEIIPQR